MNPKMHIPLLQAVTTSKPFYAFLGMVGAFLLHVPDEIRTLTCMAFVLIICDFASGVTVAFLRGNVRSKDARSRAVAKIGQYSNITVIAGAACIVAQTWLPMKLVLGSICAIEVLSLWENALRMQKYGGIDMKSFTPAFEASRRFFAIDQDDEKENAQDAADAATAAAAVNQAQASSGNSTTTTVTATAITPDGNVTSRATATTVQDGPTMQTPPSAADADADADADANPDPDPDPDPSDTSAT